jgi:phenylalanyl-tRNA synthetase alpha chain
MSQLPSSASSVVSQSQDWQAQITSSKTLGELDDIRIRLLGKSGEITHLLKGLGGLPADQRKERGAQINHLRDTIAQALEGRKEVLKDEALRARLSQESVDVTLSSRPEEQGTLHPITRTIQEILAYFQGYGFEVAEGPDIEDEEHNFTALNIPEHHPARQSHDTFYFHPSEAGVRLLRTHTSPVQIRTLKKRKPPLRIVVPGRVYRCDYDATHAPMFHQIEVMVIDKGIHFGHLKSCVIEFCKSFFEVEDLKVRFRPSFFPFTEPSAEMDIGCDRTGGTLKIGTGEDWLEVFGCGMVHPNVLRNCDIDPDAYQGFAIGMGVDRFAMLKYGIPDIRPMFESDARWLSHYGFSPSIVK